MNKIQWLGLALIIAGTVLVTREVWPRVEPRIVRIPEPVVIDLSDSTRADYQKALDARDDMIDRQDRAILELLRRPPVVTRDTQFVEVPVGTACEADSFPPRWRIRDLTVGGSAEERTVMRAEKIEADSGRVVVSPIIEQHTTLGPLRGAFPRADGSGIRLEFDDWPEPGCGFWCQMLRRAEGGAVMAGACLLTR